ncbi:hypothetical protein W02_24180 [Nitrospira sp. KM1]|uniref:hypothetical protein n=1 Tax=Nitrospira sp. KM1 TaxID=1936990 RepID=UPI0013A78D4B|nr:hypothetical protein [Nitrospira sp. KM1]BCA55278.1 hypothetical protein W02_24180 [Nitrospira sp. KM1]
MVEQTRAVVHLATGMSPTANVMAESSVVLRAKYTGAPGENIDGYVGIARNRLRWMVYDSTVSVLA